MKVVIASDHGGFEYKNLLLETISQHGFEVSDLGAFNKSPSDYPDFAELVATALLNNEAQKGILICGSGAGVSVAANKFKGIRACVCHDSYSAHQCVEHDNVNVLCIGERVIGIELAKEIVVAFLNANFSNEERHLRRFNKVNAIEAANFLPNKK